MMLETEKAILATIIEYPQLVHILFENCTVDLFEGEDNKVIFRLIEELKREGESIDWYTIIDLSTGKTKQGYATHLLNYALATPPSVAEGWLLKKIGKLKRYKARKESLRELDAESRGFNPDPDKIIRIAEESKVIGLSKEKASLKEALERYEDWQDKKTTNIYLSIPSLDRQTDDYGYGDLIGIMSRTAVGKTFFSINILNHLINKETGKIGFFSLEMSKATFIERVMQVFFNKSRQYIKEKRKKGELYMEEFKQDYKDLNLYNKIYSVSEISKIVDDNKLKVIFIDYLQLIKKTKGRSLYEETSYQMEEIKELAKNKNIVIFLLIQITRKGEGGWEPVTMDMARNSGTIEEHCDFLIGLWRPELKPKLGEKAMEKWNNKIVVKLLKNKRGITVGENCFFNKESGRILEIGKED